MATTSTTTVLAIWQAIWEGVAVELVSTVPVFLIFSFMLGMFLSVIIIMSLWKIR